MTREAGKLAAAAALLMAITMPGPTAAQKPGGTLRLSHFDSPASMSILEEATRAAEEPAMAVM
ncbi:MAG: peptide ABC transporter substrate-binding protein, partial [Alphaproteobacteria bacterium]|nr:peptide ABC transporter substrate-binding protein [Alphaproteobacteria bacterium]